MRKYIISEEVLRSERLLSFIGDQAYLKDTPIFPEYTAIELMEIATKYLKENGAERFAKVISDAMDKIPIDNNSIYSCRHNVINKLIALSTLNLTDR